ncbi:hypothetical protein HDIA_3197 [Hartmannibacter diazotrophicus]|uniref:Glycolipid-binding domain-containing protein n=1 Tax=Hartmannibacter diazotrophicus TaxID=1482074 RepID=A0A2C9D9B6_9HYPH|nr:putative glycolipid-binding domain-containing protein [Hartmannibacter diazotrophicus]SON56738.1 hypothetical protein HDIA_3197 [Hartmannibacter diazotrophicus]
MDRWQVLWSRLDQKGMDACRIYAGGDGWTIEGTATFVDGDAIASLSYRLLCGHNWATREADVRGWVGGRELSLRIGQRPDGVWVVDGRPVDLSHGLLDVDLGFSPASNTNAIRRLDLGIGEKTETTAVWLDTADWTAKPLLQTYERISPTVLAYTSPRHGYEASLVTNEFGIVLDYPGLWKAEYLHAY